MIYNTQLLLADGVTNDLVTVASLSTEVWFTKETMSTEQPVYVTSEGLRKLEETLNYLKTVKYPRMIEQLQETSAGGYTIDNTEYITTKSEMDMLEARIEELGQVIASAQIITAVQRDSVGLGNTVVVQVEGEDETETYTIVGAAEADPLEGYISNVSPFGRALLNHKVGDTVTVSSPDGNLNLRIVTIS